MECRLRHSRRQGRTPVQGLHPAARVDDLGNLHSSFRPTILLMNKTSNMVSHRRAKIKVRKTSGGLHLFNRETGTNVLIDEIRPAADTVALAPRQVSIALTNACDLACEYCYAPKTPAVLSFERLAPWLRDLDANGTIGVGFGGGEPTLYPRFAELCEFMTAETNLAVTFTTHAHRLTENFLHALRGNINFVRVSMDGIEKTYESNRGRSFNDLIKRIDSLRRITPFGINFVVNSHTFPDLDGAIELASMLEAREFLLLPEMPTHLRSGIDPDTANRLKSWVHSYRGPVPLAISEGNTDGLPTCDPLQFETGLAAFAHIDAMGTLKRTSYDVFGVKIDTCGVIETLRTLQKQNHRSKR